MPVYDTGLIFCKDLNIFILNWNRLQLGLKLDKHFLTCLNESYGYKTYDIN